MAHKITIFTPTYNRARLLSRLYQSLLAQTFTSFEWLIVDDGSIDNTEAVIRNFKKQKKIDINYIYQKNAGKHIAINNGVSHAKGELFFIVDSDDVLPENSLKIVEEYYQKYKNKVAFGGVVGRRMDFEGNTIGTHSIISSKFDTTLNLRYQDNIWGDFAEVYLTRVLEEFQFPHVEDERFVPEGIVWNRIAQKYKVQFINRPIYIGDYLTDGLTSKMVKIRMRSPQLAMKYYEELAKYSVPFKTKIKSYINFWRFAFHYNKSYYKNFKSIGFSQSTIGFPFGFLLYLKDKYQYK